jgi:signal transduction histidine kinase
LRILIEKVVSQYENNLLQNKQQITIIWEIEKKVDKNLFKQIVHNLIWNFLKYAWIWTTMTIILTEEYIIFKDNWEWTDKKEVPLLKEKFYQAKKEKSWKIEERWIGVWLSIVSKIVKLHSWEMSIVSDYKKWFLVKIIFWLE